MDLAASSSSLDFNVWAIADLHLAHAVPEKTMEAFGGSWQGYVDKLQNGWRAHVQPEDLVLIAGDISWAMSVEEVKADLEWIDHLPGQKVLIKGNHDFWWSSLSKIEKVRPPSLHLLQNNVFVYRGVAIGGTRLWESEEYHFSTEEKTPKPSLEDVKIFARELLRLEMSLKQLPQEAPFRFAMTHYPPISLDLRPSQASALFEKYRVQSVVFGHLHHLPPHTPCFGEKNGIRYLLTSCDYLDFSPLSVFSSEKWSF